ncbi:unnamed protein product [Mycena citricolor]|uniref:G-alpha-domain-containing protein n=1 Tax=Mycena citricolor TaxID=2018698 RepID=A0AAD2K885_9AGAR|nr:unnamed protein product [Mycena citricolor]
MAKTHRSQLSDPFSALTQPPANETPAERHARVQAEQEQKRVSDQIDEELKRERVERKKRAKREVLVLLLGQSESGKSTVLKNFRMKYAATQWKAELRSWRTVVQLNLIQNVITILDHLDDRLASHPSLPPGSEAGSSSPPVSFQAPMVSYGRASIDSNFSDMSMATSTAPGVTLSQKHRILNLRLSPLRKVAEDLRRRLGADDPDLTFANGDDGAALGFGGALPDERRAVRQEFGVRGWIGALGLNSPFGGARRGSSDRQGQAMSVDEATEILASLSEDISALWNDEDVQLLLQENRVRMEDQPGFFLADTERITSRDYVPSDNDVVRARLRTLGVQEWRIVLENGDSFGSEWVIYDVGGSRSMVCVSLRLLAAWTHVSQRHAWLPYFDSMNAIIFLAPISCFDERLEEDPSVNRLEDTLLLWRAIVSSKLLAETTLVEAAEWRSSQKYLISYGERENEVSAVVKYLKDKFKDILRVESAGPRSAYLYATSVTDTKATAATLNILRDSLIREHLKHAEFL